MSFGETFRGSPLLLSPKKLIILCLYSPEHDEAYILDRNAQLATWVPSLPKTFSTYWVVGQPDIKYSQLTGSILEVPCLDRDMYKKTILAIEFCMQQIKFDYILRTNTSTYFFPKKLEKVIWRMNNLAIDFCGFPLGISLKNFRNDEIYCSGAGIFLSQKASECLLNNTNYDLERPDDIKISQIMRKHFDPYWIPRTDLELFPVWRTRAIVRLKHPLNSLKTSDLMKLMHLYSEASHPYPKLKAYLILTVHALSIFREKQITCRQWLVRMSIIIKTAFYIKYSNIVFIGKRINSSDSICFWRLIKSRDK
jgi:hypothetical protein